MPISMPIIRDTTTAAEAMPCCADGTTRRVADVSGPITSPSPSPAIARSVSSTAAPDLMSLRANLPVADALSRVSSIVYQSSTV